ncbi:MAG: tetratricopeptide repeat protein [Chthoniobacteraceae bacterium]
MALPLALCMVVIVGVFGWGLAHREKNRPAGAAPAAAVGAKFALEPEAKVFARYAGAESCRECHSAAFDKWKGSHHGLAERNIDPQFDRVAFEPPREIKAGTQVSNARLEGGKFQLITTGLKSPGETFMPDRVIGVDPLRQFLIPSERGRWQTAELAWDPHQQEWFDIYGNEDRQPGEWGHWTGRGMTWNQMCASCHNTRVRKNYDPATDAYHTTMAAMTVGCEACHGPMRAHVDWQKKNPGQSGDPTPLKLTRDQMLDTCGTCHARRGELTGDFVPGEKFFDHFALTIPDETDTFHPDGQVHDEDYEFTSFLSSKMHLAGVRCVDCHDPHTSKNPLEGNALCLRCHGAPVAPAPKIVDPEHSFHQAGTAGSRCVDCHMPETTYMQRHPRRDHGFTIPDPLLTKEHNIPNACNRCHADKSADWALEFCDKWYGEKMNRPTRTRAQWVAQARAGTSGASANLLRMLSEEKIPLWRAVATNLLRNSLREPGVIPALNKATHDPSELVRSMAARAIGGLVQPSEPASGWNLTPLLNDPTRAVRIDAAWALHRTVDTSVGAGSELLHYLNFNRDQPIGLMQWADFLTEHGDRTGGLEALRQAVEWDKGSPPLRQNYAVALSQAGQPGEAANQLAEAVRLAPRDAQIRYTYALALNEMNRPAEAHAELERTVKLDPQFGRAWYNLGLARNAANQIELALIALARAEALDPGNPQAPYAAATILARQQRTREAEQAARRALRVAPNYPEAAELLRVLSAGAESR